MQSRSICSCSGVSGSITAEFLSAYALMASGFAQRKPERIGSALDLQSMRDVGVDAEMACASAAGPNR